MVRVSNGCPHISVKSPFSRLFGIAAAAAAITASPLAAQEEPEVAPLPDFAQLSEDEAFEAFNEDRRRWVEEPCDFGVPILQVMDGYNPGRPPILRTLSLAQAFCADEEDRYADGALIMRDRYASDPANPHIGLTLYFATRAEDADLALDTFGWLNKDTIDQLNAGRLWPAMRVVAQSGRADEFESQALKWFDDNLIGFIDGDLHEGLARHALIAAARDNRDEIAGQLLRYITGPSTYIDMLTSREYEAFWPQIGQRAGPNLSLIGAENLEIARRRLTNAPGERDRFSATARALHYHGEFSEAVALAQTWREREERGLELEEGDAWALNIQAYAYDSLGQPELADAVFEELAEIEIEDNNWVVSFLINRASRLVGHGRWAEGLAATQYARTVPGSTYAEMIVAKDHACALYQLGRVDEAQAELEFLRENKSASVPLAAMALQCLGMRDEAAQMLIEGLGDSATRSGIVSALQRPEADLFYTQSMLPDARSLMADYPELAAEFAKHARDLPAEFTPRAATLRVELDLPEWE